MMKTTTLLLATLLATAAFAQEPAPCSAFQTDVSAEVELFQRAPVTVDAAGDATSARMIEVGRLYEVRLQSQKQVRYVAQPERKPDPTQTGGMLRIMVPEGGDYRVSVDARSWVDAVFAGVALATDDFRSDRQCSGPTKMVTFNVPAGAELVLQFIDVDRPSLRLAVTAAPQKVW